MTELLVSLHSLGIAATLQLPQVIAMIILLQTRRDRGPGDRLQPNQFNNVPTDPGGVGIASGRAGLACF